MYARGISPSTIKFEDLPVPYGGGANDPRRPFNTMELHHNFPSSSSGSSPPSPGSLRVPEQQDGVQTDEESEPDLDSGTPSSSSSAPEYDPRPRSHAPPKPTSKSKDRWRCEDTAKCPVAYLNRKEPKACGTSFKSPHYLTGRQEVYYVHCPWQETTAAHEKTEAHAVRVSLRNGPRDLILHIERNHKRLFHSPEEIRGAANRLIEEVRSEVNSGHPPPQWREFERHSNSYRAVMKT